ncbi:MAG: 3'(2'),5'-bisphosphate nucleotidase CysQ [Rickettsiaceae bacterium]|uniref:3'(2'),5'-bisphosphate nucleotidase CysQ n=1 Tax=Candidatus Tisiphia endosymbiont of Ptychoptera albimana TaxID=3066260 RepID=UPI00312C9536|nr:3'(2'),5'-bisphosphate nucleotidase CysQ [Rickettsiaceae bacterium]MDD9337580.1 3'(2'),5'-bisphosphate nucleotidase CysQ [Rickettsiaceae bacterium]
MMLNLIKSLKSLITEAGGIALIRRDLGLIVSYKDDNSPVTNADKEISSFIYDGLKDLAPNIPVVCEERDIIALNDNQFWLIDPIDGTKSYIKGEDTYTVNIALIKNGMPIIGFIYQPSVQKLYYTDANNALRIEQNGVETSFDALPKTHYRAVVSSRSSNSDIKKFLKKHLITEIVTIPSSIKLCLVAEGKADIYPKFGPTMEWDIAAGHALIKASGGNIVDIDGNELVYQKKNFQNPHFYAYSRYFPIFTSF